MLQEQMMAFALMGGEWVLWLLVLLSVLCLTIAVERFIFATRNQTSLSRLQPILTRFLGGGEITACAEELKDIKGMEARVLSAGLEAAQNGGAEAASEVVAGQLIFEKSKIFIFFRFLLSSQSPQTRPVRGLAWGLPTPGPPAFFFPL